MNRRRLFFSGVIVLVVVVVHFIRTAHDHNPQVIFKDRLDAVLPGCIEASNIDVAESGGVLILRFTSLRIECLNQLIRTVLPISKSPVSGVPKEEIAYLTRLLSKDERFQKALSGEPSIRIANTRSGLHLVDTKFVVVGDDSAWIILIEAD